MALFPTTPKPVAPMGWRLIRPVARGGPLWHPKTRRMTRFELAAFDLSYKLLGSSYWTDFASFRDFWNTVGGADGTFAFADPQGAKPWTDLFVAKGIGSDDIYTLPSYGGVTSPTVKINGTPVGGGTFSITTGAGSDGLDQIDLTSDLAADAILTLSGTFARAMPKARFQADEFPMVTDDPPFIHLGPIAILEARA